MFQPHIYSTFLYEVPLSSPNDLYLYKDLIMIEYVYLYRFSNIILIYTVFFIFLLLMYNTSMKYQLISN